MTYNIKYKWTLTTRLEPMKGVKTLSGTSGVVFVVTWRGRKRSSIAIGIKLTHKWACHLA